MTMLSRLETSDVWDEEWQLPIARAGGNPHIYTAYCDLILKLYGEGIWAWKYDEFFASCTVPGQAGLFKRWPDGRFGNTSHDEVMGAAHMSNILAFLIIRRLDESGGTFNPLGLPESKPERWNLYRMVWLRPYLSSRARYRVNLFEQLLWAAKVFISAFRDHKNWKVGPGPRLRAWLMAYEMRRYPICLAAWRFYRKRMERAGCSLAHDLRQEPAWEVLTNMAPSPYIHPQDMQS